jgi:hypothetical protein
MPHSGVHNHPGRSRSAMRAAWDDGRVVEAGTLQGEGRPSSSHSGRRFPCRTGGFGITTEDLRVGFGKSSGGAEGKRRCRPAERETPRRVRRWHRGYRDSLPSCPFGAAGGDVRRFGSYHRFWRGQTPSLGVWWQKCLFLRRIGPCPGVVSLALDRRSGSQRPVVDPRVVHHTLRVAVRLLRIVADMEVVGADLVLHPANRKGL